MKYIFGKCDKLKENCPIDKLRKDKYQQDNRLVNYHHLK